MGDRLTVGGTWLVPNVRGDVAALLDPTQTSISDAYRYDPFGVLLASLGTSVNPYRFQGRLLEPTSGQYDFGSRQYDPALAGFTSIDTVLGQAANPISLNRYLYTLADPESMIDPDGHAACNLGREDCAEMAASSKLDALRAAAAAAWRHSLAAAATTAQRTATAAWANYRAARDRATAAHQALTRAERQLAAIKKRQSAPVAKVTVSYSGPCSPANMSSTCGDSPGGSKLDPTIPVLTLAAVVGIAACFASGLCEAIGGMAAAACLRFCDTGRSAGAALNEGLGGSPTGTGGVAARVEVSLS